MPIKIECPALSVALTLAYDKTKKAFEKLRVKRLKENKRIKKIKTKF